MLQSLLVGNSVEFYDEDEKIPAGIINKIMDGEVGSKVKIKGEEHTITSLMKKRANMAKTLKGLK